MRAYHYIFIILLFFTQTSQSQSLLSEFKKQKRVLLHQWGYSSRANTATLASNKDWINQNLSPFDGVYLYLDEASFSIMTNTPVNYDDILQELSPMVGLNLSHLKYNLALVYNDKPADPFDNWDNVIQNWSKMARAVRNSGLLGIAFDNEQYFDTWFDYPDDCKYKSKTLAEYQNQVRLRGKQIMEAMVAEYPEIVVVHFHGPYISESKGPDIIYNIPKIYVELLGPFFTGFLEGKGDSAMVLDGGEMYYLRSKNDFATAYNWQKYGIASSQTNCSFIPSVFRPSWSEKINITYGIYDDTDPLTGDIMNPSIWDTTVRNALMQADYFVWTYFEVVDMFSNNGNEWVKATESGKEAALGVITSSESLYSFAEIRPQVNVYHQAYSENIKVDVKLIKPDYVTIEILNYLGQIVEIPVNKQYVLDYNSFTFQNHKYAGLYIVKITIEDYVICKKIGF
jgi:hypothetical protein